MAGFTNVSATVLDPNSVPYANGTWTANFVDPGTPGKTPLINSSIITRVYAGDLDSFGNFTISLPDNAVIASQTGAVGTQWTFTFAAKSTPIGLGAPPAFSVGPLTITGASQNITSNIQAVSALLTVSPAIALKYAASEGVQHVSPNGNDNNDGLSPGSAKLTIPAAVTAITGSTVKGGTVKLAAGTYAIGSPGLNLTLLNGLTLEGATGWSDVPGVNVRQGTVITCNFTGAGTVGVDISGSNHLTFRNILFSFGTSTSNAPTVGFLHGRTSGSNGIFNKLENCWLVGFSPWTYYNFRGEQFSAVDCLFEEQATTGVPVTISAVNTAGITSPNVTLGGANSTSIFKFMGGNTTIISQATSGTPNALLYLDEGSSKIESVWLDGFMDQAGTNNFIITDTSGATGSLFNINTNIHGNSGSATNNAMISIAGLAANWTLLGRIDPFNNSGGPALSFSTIRNSTINLFTSQTNAFSATSVVGATVTSSAIDGTVLMVPSSNIVAEVNLTAQAANIATTTLYAVPAGGAGMYRFSAYIVITQAATTSATIPGCQVVFTDADTNIAQSNVGTVVLQSLTANTVGSITSYNPTTNLGTPSITINARASTNIQYNTFNYASSGATAMQYALHIRLEYLGA